MSPLFWKILSAAGTVAVVFIALFVIIEITIWMRKHPVSWKIPGSDTLGKELKAGWDKHGAGIIKSIALISVSLLFFNWLCAETGFEWWQAWRAKVGLFVVSQISLLFSFYVLMLKIESWIPKAAALVVLLIIAIGVVKTSNERRNQHDRVESERLTRELASIMPVPVRGPVTRQLKAGAWMAFDVNDKVKIDEVTDRIPFTCRLNDSLQEYRIGPNEGNLDLTAMAPGVFIWRVLIKPDKDMTVTIR